LHNEIQRMVVMAEQEAPLAPHLLSVRVTGGEGLGAKASGFNGPANLKDQVEALERAAIGRMLADCAGNISHAAEKLGLSRVGLRAKIDRYDLRKDVTDA
jgi:two-component system response regulator HupR/HoxA